MLERVNVKVSDTPLFLKQPPLFYQPLPFYGKKYEPPFFWVNFKKSISSPL